MGCFAGIKVTAVELFMSKIKTNTIIAKKKDEEKNHTKM